MEQKSIEEQAKERIINGKNDCYLNIKFGNTIDTLTEIEMEINCSKMQLVLALIALASKIQRSDVMWVKDFFRECTPKPTEEDMLKTAIEQLKKELEENGQEGNIPNSK